jgi:uncharacterized protein (DUF2147 family)
VSNLPVLAAVLLAASAWLTPIATAAISPEGRWLLEDGDGVIEIAPCPAGLCGRLVGLGGAGREDTPPANDWQGRPRCGLTILEATPSGPGRWEGRITNPEDGTAWQCAFWVDAAGRLNLRGYVLVPLFGQTQVWTHFTGALGTDCTIR